jgi:hypothetical protein
MANYPQLDNSSGVWNLREVYDAVMGGYWPNYSSKGLQVGGGSPADQATIQQITIASAGDATGFGNLATAMSSQAGFSSLVRGCFAGGSPTIDTIEYITFTTEGNAADFGNLTDGVNLPGGGSNSTRGLVAGGRDPNMSNIINYNTISSLGNSVDFGDLTQARALVTAMPSPTRCTFAGGFTPSAVNTIDFVEIATTGNATDFGDCVATQYNMGGTSSSTRGVTMGAYNGGQTGVCDFLTIASQGNMINFGDLSVTRINAGGTSNSVRAVLMGGQNASGNATNPIDFGIIANGGTWTDFGDCLNNLGSKCAQVSDSHGGLNDGYQGTRPIPFQEVGGDRGIIAGGQTPTKLNEIGFITISSTGNENEFGDLSQARAGLGGIGGKTRAIFGGGNAAPVVTASAVIDYVEFSTKGNAADFGDLTSGRFTFRC